MIVVEEEDVNSSHLPNKKTDNFIKEDKIFGFRNIVGFNYHLVVK